MIQLRLFPSSFSDQSTSWAVPKTGLPSLQPLGQRPVHFSQMPNRDCLRYPVLRGSRVSRNQLKLLDCESVGYHR